MKKVNILGTEYRIYLDKSEEEEPRLTDLAGVTDYTTKEIFVYKGVLDTDNTNGNNKVCYQHKILRHEIIHAFLYESGLNENSRISSRWAENEEMVDWFAIQSPKIFKVYKELGIL